MIVQRGMQKELIIYWFQSYDRTNPDTLSQKIHALWKKLRLQREDNAFVRVSMAFEGTSPKKEREIIFDFIREFYPAFLSYIRQGNER
jgi:EpsI family protein